jgi:hypothetical protein
VLLGGHYIFAIGGEDSCGNENGLVEIYDIDQPSQGWQPGSAGSIGVSVPPLSLSSRAVYLSAVGLELTPSSGGNDVGAIVALGGRVGPGFTASTVTLSEDKPMWLNLSPLPQPIYQGAAVVDGNGCVDLIGGEAVDGGLVGGVAGGNPTGGVETLCGFSVANGYVSAGTWSTSAASLFEPTFAEAVAQDDAGVTYVVGGNPGTYAYQIDPFFSGPAQLFNAPNYTHYAGGAAVLGSTLYSFGGGDDGLHPAQPYVDTYDLTQGLNGTWNTSSAQLNVGRQFFGTVTDRQNRIYIVGGEDEHLNVLGSMEVFDATSGTWTLVP